MYHMSALYVFDTYSILNTIIDTWESGSGVVGWDEDCSSNVKVPSEMDETCIRHIRYARMYVYVYIQYGIYGLLQ